jgi:hypothetical protein
VRCVPAISVAIVFAALLAGCGGEAGVSEGASVSVYVDSGLCAGARQALAEAGGRAGDLEVRAVCLPPTEAGERLDLAAAGANARRAAEDSTAVAYLEPVGARAGRFTHPILDSAEIPWGLASSGDAAMTQALEAIAEADSGSLRDQVGEALDASQG